MTIKKVMLTSIILLTIMLLAYTQAIRADKEITNKFDEEQKELRIDKEITRQFNEGKEYVSIIITEPPPNILRAQTEQKRPVITSKQVTKKELEQLTTDGVSIEYDRPISIFMQDANNITRTNESWNLQANSLNITGQYQSACILDTGINSNHPDFAGKIRYQKCYCTNSDLGGGGCCPDTTAEDENATDDHGHGTHVAGILGANGSLKGIAPRAGLVIVKIMDSGGSGMLSDLINGIQWCIDNAATYNITIITASLGDAGTKYNTTCDDVSTTLTNTINSAYAQNISITIAAGNNHWTDGITWPACISNATPIGAVDKTNNLAYNRHSLVKLFGIGVAINSTYHTTPYTTSGGTSMATPMVAGAILLLKQYLNQTRITKTPTEIEDYYYNNGYNITESGNNYTRINTYYTLLAADKTPPTNTHLTPTNNTVSAGQNQSFTCNATDWQLANITLNLWNTSTLYYNETKNLTGTNNNTNYTITNIPEGTYTWNCRATDTQGNSNRTTTNYTITMGGILVELISPSDTAETNDTTQNFTCNATTTNNGQLNNITFYLWDTSGTLLYNTTTNIAGTENTSLTNYSFTTDGNYTWNCKGTTNTSEQTQATTNYTLRIDSTAPSISSIITTITSSSATITWTTSEPANGYINGDLNSDHEDYTTDHSITITGLDSGQTYDYTITSCDTTGNCQNSDQQELTTTSGGGSGGGGGGSSSTQTPTEIYTSEQGLTNGIQQTLNEEELVYFTLDNNRHTITINTIREGIITLTIQSEPLTISLMEGEEQKINLTSPYYYDLYINIISIEPTTTTTIYIKKINETITTTTQEKVTLPPEEEKTITTMNETKPEKITTNDKTVDKKLLLPIIIASLIVLSAIDKLFIHRRLKKRKEQREQKHHYTHHGKTNKKMED